MLDSPRVGNRLPKAPWQDQPLRFVRALATFIAARFFAFVFAVDLGMSETLAYGHPRKSRGRRVFSDEVSPHLQSANRSVVWKDIFRKLFQERHAELQVNPLTPKTDHRCSPVTVAGGLCGARWNRHPGQIPQLL